jgi:hypothetical protein
MSASFRCSNERPLALQQQSRLLPGTRGGGSTNLKETTHAQESSTYPTGISIGMISDDAHKLGLLIFETCEGNIEFAVNLQTIDVLTRAINSVGLELRSDRKPH